MAGLRKNWQEIKPLGKGGQSKVFLVRNATRQGERTESLQNIRTALDADRRADLATAIWSYARPDAPSELGALKLFKIPPQGMGFSPMPGSENYEAVERLKGEIAVLCQGLPGLPAILDSNEEERWIVTEYFPQKTLEDNPQKFRGKVIPALRAFRTLVQTVARLHHDGYIHRDIKAGNVFLSGENELVLGDFGLVYRPDAIRVTATGEKVGPRDIMPQWANLGARLENVQPNLDIYLLGKLLWTMIDGRAVLPREYHRKKEYDFDLTRTFPHDPEMHLVNEILDKCVVEHAADCKISAQDLLIIVDTTLQALDRGGLPIKQDIPRPCRVCGVGFYEREGFVGSQPQPTARDWIGLRFWISGNETTTLPVRVLTCGYCGHIQLFNARLFDH